MNKIMERKIEIVLEAIEDVIIKDGIESCTIVWETINKLIEQYPDSAGDISAHFKKICNTYKVDCFEQIRVTGEEINEYINNIETKL